MAQAITPSIAYEDAAKAIKSWLCRAFGFEVRLKVEGDEGVIHHSELTFGDGVVMIGSIGKHSHPARRRPIEGARANFMAARTRKSLMVYVDDVEAHCARARAAGAKIVTEPKTSDYGEEYWTDRSYEAEDLDGHRWWFAQRLREAGAGARHEQ